MACKGLDASAAAGLAQQHSHLHQQPCQCHGCRGAAPGASASGSARMCQCQCPLIGPTNVHVLVPTPGASQPSASPRFTRLPQTTTSATTPRWKRRRFAAPSPCSRSGTRHCASCRSVRRTRYGCQRPFRRHRGRHGLASIRHPHWPRRRVGRHPHSCLRTSRRRPRHRGSNRHHGSNRHRREAWQNGDPRGGARRDGTPRGPTGQQGTPRFRTQLRTHGTGTNADQTASGPRPCPKEHQLRAVPRSPRVLDRLRSR